MDGKMIERECTQSSQILCQLLWVHYDWVLTDRSGSSRSTDRHATKTLFGNIEFGKDVGQKLASTNPNCSCLHVFTPDASVPNGGTIQFETDAESVVFVRKVIMKRYIDCVCATQGKVVRAIHAMVLCIGVVDDTGGC